MKYPARMALCFLFMVSLVTACSGRGGRDYVLLQNKGSDTLVNVAQAWAERYRSVNPKVAVAVSGGGSGTGIAALINGTVDIANASREMKPSELEAVRKTHNVEAVEHTVARDAVVVFLHSSNPLRQATLAQLACIYGEGGKCEKWSDLGVEVPNCAGQEIIRVSRQSNSGTYEFFRETVVGKTKDFKLGSRDMQGSKDVVDLVAKTPCSIGYSGMGYATDQVISLCVSPEQGKACVSPTPANALSGLYPLSRPLHMYTLGEAKGEIKKYLEWIQSSEGQKIVSAAGFVPLQ